MKLKRVKLAELEKQLDRVQIMESDAIKLTQEELDSSLSVLSSEEARV